MRSTESERPGTTVASLFIWKWAANEVRGDVPAILEALREEEGHPALAAFEAQPVIERLDTALTAIRKENPTLLTCLKELQQGGSTVALSAKLVGHYDYDAVAKALGLAVTGLGLTASDAHEAKLLRGCLPKRCAMKFDTERVPGLPQYDPLLAEVLESLGRVDVRKGICYAILNGANGDYVQTYGCDGKFSVEWRTYHDRTWLDYDHHTAGRRPRSTKQVWLGESKHHVTAFKHELLERSDVERIFTAFYRGEKRPRAYTWRNVTECLESLEPKPDAGPTNQDKGQVGH